MANEILSTLKPPLEALTWSSSLQAMLAVFESGTPKGRSLAKQNLQRMAELADLAVDAVKTSNASSPMIRCAGRTSAPSWRKHSD